MYDIVLKESGTSDHPIEYNRQACHFVNVFLRDTYGIAIHQQIMNWTQKVIWLTQMLVSCNEDIK